MHLIFLKKIAFATLIARHLKRGVGVKEESGMGDGGDWRVLISLIGFFQIAINHYYRESYLLQFPSLFHCSYSFSMCILT